MINRRLFFIVCAVIALVALLLAYGIEQIWFGFAMVFFAGLFGGIGWFSNQKELSSWMINLFWLGVVFLVSLGAFLDLNTGLLIAAVVTGLGAWDLIRFQKNLEGYSPSENILKLERQHLKLLGVTLLGGGILAVVVAYVRIQISFYLALVLGVILILILGVIIRYFARLAGRFE